ncbi:hypothetical protein NNJEOMEG_01457 [Fundidesulfovibrio magnetotacticus]|uniref:DMT family transporter n=1 Tax=Fundidesulfovibrio magnetotacticus TaxID=2730080 RepID=A0A6V8LLQ9_9BACT|nr:DMT family transporter [Fundidesulfovibrio magnetotacticus]GFK93623.1 hypothetical protein NNJEOMEG_01457 [Fundidesulfovibrio magnetotacticus]
MEKLPLLVLAVAAGALIPVQAGVNVLLRGRLSDPAQAAFVSFLVGTLCLLGWCLAQRLTWPSPGDLARTPPWLWIGGALGAFFVATTIYLGPRLGAATMTAFMLAGQLVASVLLDHHGLLGFPEHAASPARIAGVVLLGLGAWMIKSF